MEGIGFHPAATAATTAEARAARDELDRAAAADPAGFRRRFAELVHAPPSPERAAILNRGFDRAYGSFTGGDWELNTVTMHPTEYVFENGGRDAGVIDLPDRLEGAAGYIEGMIAFRAGWEETTLRSEAVADAGPGRILNWAHFRFRGSVSGIELEQRTAVLLIWDGEWLVHQRYWWDREAGTRAAGVDPAALASQLQG